MDTSHSLQESAESRSTTMCALKLFLGMMTLLFPWTVKTELNDKLQTPFSNKFLRMHAFTARQTALRNCWLCTRSPVSSGTMSYIATPLNVSEIIELTRGPITSPDKSRVEEQIPLKIVKWTGAPWFLFNRTGDPRAGFLGNVQLPPKHGYVLSCFPNYTSCECLQVEKPEIVRRYPAFFGSLNSTNCNGESDAFTSCIGVNAPGQTWCIQQVQKWLLLNMKNALAGKVTSTQEEIINTTTFDLQLAKSLVNLFNQSGNTLPTNVYFVCGTNAYKWLPPRCYGICTLAKLSPGSWVWEDEDI